MPIPVTDTAQLVASSVASSGATATAPAPPVSAVATPTTDTFANRVGQLFTAVQSGDLATAQQNLPIVKGADWPFYPPARVGLTPQTAVQNDLRAFVTAVLSGDTGRAQQALTALAADMGDVTTSEAPPKAAPPQAAPTR